MGDDREMARQFAMARIAFGVGMLAVPGVVGRVWLGSPGRHRGVKAIVRGFGMRDIALGIATLDAIDEDRPVNRLLQLGVACDATDSAAILLTGEDVGWFRKLFILALAGFATATGIRLASNLD